MNWREALEAAEGLAGPVRERADGLWSFDTVELPSFRIVPAERTKGSPTLRQAEEARVIFVQSLAERFVTRLPRVAPALEINAEIAPDY